MAPRSNGSLHALSRAIGGLEASVKHLTNQIEKESETAAHHRQSLREVIGSLSEAMRVQTERMNGQTEKITEVKGAVAEV